jgi:hypothetical protein
LARKAVVLLLNGRFYWKEFDSSHASNIFWSLHHFVNFGGLPPVDMSSS